MGVKDKHMDMECYGYTDEKVRQELDRRSKLAIRNIEISPLFEAEKLYNIDEKSPRYQQEDVNGTMRPQNNHCWITWESKWIDYEDSEDGKERWSTEAYNFPSLEKAALAREYLLAKSV